MTALSVITLGGMLGAAGIVLAVATLRPAPPKLAAGLAQLAASPTTSGAGTGPVRVGGRWGWLPVRVAQFVAEHVGVSDADLAILSMTRSQLAARKLTYGAVGLLAPSVVSVLLSLLGGQLPIMFPAALTLILTTGLWMSPSRDVKAKAEELVKSSVCGVLLVDVGGCSELGLFGSVTQACCERVGPGGDADRVVGLAEG